MYKLNLLDQLFYKLETVRGSPVLMCGAMIVDPAGSPYPVNAKNWPTTSRREWKRFRPCGKN